MVDVYVGGCGCVYVGVCGYARSLEERALFLFAGWDFFFFFFLFLSVRMIEEFFLSIN